METRAFQTKTDGIVFPRSHPMRRSGRGRNLLFIQYNVFSEKKKNSLQKVIKMWIYS